MCKFTDKEFRENAPAARRSEEAGLTQFLTYKYTLLSTKVGIPKSEIPSIKKVK